MSGTDQGPRGDGANTSAPLPAQSGGFAAPSNPFFAPPVPGTDGRLPQSPPAATGAPSPSAAGAGAALPLRPEAAGSGTGTAAVVLAVVGAIVGLAIGWGLPLSLVAIVLAVRARRRPGGSAAVLGWSIALAAVSALGAAAWLAYSAVVLLT